VSLFASLLGGASYRVDSGVQENVRFVPFLGELFGPTDDLYCVRDGCKALRHQGTKG
jgi:hypothetical protein